MPPYNLLPQRSAVEWSIRGVLALCVAGLGYLAVTQSLAQVIADNDPARAHALAPYDGRITAELANSRFAENVNAPNPDATRLARLALRQDPTAVSAAAVLGLQAELHGSTELARRFFGYAEKLSRRDLQTQLWAIEDAVMRGDIPGALRHYDIALRTERDAPNLLFPVLAAAVTDPSIRKNMVPVLAEKPLWGSDFIIFAARYSPDPQAVAALFTGLRQADYAVSSEATAIAVKRLIDIEAFEDAWRYYASVRPGASRRQSRDPRFTATLSTPSVFDWQPIDNNLFVASVQRSEQGGAFYFAAPPSAGGTVLQQLQMLPAGIYRFDGHSLNIEQPERSLPYWLLSCRSGKELGRIEIPNSTIANGVFNGKFKVPSDCAVQTLSLVLKSSNEITGVSGQIDHVQLTPIYQSQRK